jgi:hypothetical protein
MNALAEIRTMVEDGLREARHGHREVRLQQVYRQYQDGRNLATVWRATLDNGFPCCVDREHSTPEQAAECMRRRLAS